MSTALVTGATSGIGAATARALLNAGWQVIVTGRRADRLAPFAEEFGDRVHAAVFDIRDDTAVERALADLRQQFRSIDLLVNDRKTVL